VPFDHYDASSNNLKMLVDANQGRPIIVAGPIPNNDISLGAGYWLYPHGLVNVVLPLRTDVDVRQAAMDNEELSKRYKPPPFRSIKTKSFESNILFAYAAPALRLGTEYERIGNKQDAAKWYRRALDIYPDLPPARNALVRLR
jgi:tetratricopeptide (TPR) repeat protein